MNYQAFTNDSLTMMYEGIRGALAADEALKRQDEEPRFRVRETLEWKQLSQRPECSGAECFRSYRLVGRSGDISALRKHPGTGRS
jgi:hypothetical protein